MENKVNKNISGLETYFEYYFGEEPIQKADKASFDSQLNTLALKFQEFFSQYDCGTIIDLGCGEGALLSYLCEQTEFRKQKGWLYYAVDFEENLKKINELVFRLNINRRADWMELNQFYSNSVQELEIEVPLVLICRNVLHELNIEATTQLLEYLLHNTFDLLILQDLMNFKQGERGNVCWDNEILKKLLEDLGFQVVIVPMESKSRSRWLNALVKPQKLVEYKKEQIKELVIKARKAQYDLWTKEFSQKAELSILSVDRDLQIAALASQLRECEIPVENYKPDSKTILNTLKCKLSDFSGEIKGDEFKEQDDFRDRARIQDDLEKKLMNAQNRIQIIGGPKIGKTYLVNRLLAKRSYGKPVIIIELMKTSTIWSVLEQFFEKAGINISAKTFITLKKINYEDIRALILDFLNKYGGNLIIVIHYMERILSDRGEIIDKELGNFIKDITKSSVYSVFILSRIEYKEGNVYETCPLSLFPEGKHVINVLDDYIDKSKYGIESYPEKLLSAIGKHPYMAYMAAKIIRKKGIVVLDDEKFLDEIRLELHKELMKRLIDEHNLSAMQILQYIRSAMPYQEAAWMCDAGSLDQCIRDGLVIKKYEFGEEIIRCACDLGRPFINEHGQNDIQIIEKIDNAYEKAFRRTENPVYLRESIYYKICMGKKPLYQLGKMYLSEIEAAADYWYRKRDYEKVVWSCEFLEKAGFGKLELLILKAASLMRMPGKDRIKEGKEIFSKNVHKNSPYPYRSKYIDALIYTEDFEEAKRKLDELGFNENDCGAWQQYQYGCVYLGLQIYKNAILHFETALNSKPSGLIFSKLAKAYYCSGEFGKEIAILKRAYNYTKDPNIRLKYANALLRSGMSENISQAGEILKELYENELKGDINLLVIYCRYLCRTGDLTLANQIYHTCQFDERFKIQKQNMELDLSMAARKWKKCENIIENMCVDDAYKMLLKKRLYLHIARTISSREYAEKGLKVRIPTKYKKNVPLRLAHCSLAKYLGRVDILKSEKNYIHTINKNIDIYETSSWEDVLADDFIQ